MATSRKDTAVSEEFDDRDDREARTLSARIEGLVPDVMKRTFYTGLGALFLTEDGIRRQLAELKVPKDITGYIVSQSSRSKEELFDAIAREVAKVFQDTTPEEIVRNAMTGMKMKIEVEFEPADADKDSGGTKVKFRTQAKEKK